MPPWSARPGGVFGGVRPGSDDLQFEGLEHRPGPVADPVSLYPSSPRAPVRAERRRRSGPTGQRVWKVTGSPYRGTVVAGWAGRVVAVLALMWPLAQPLVFEERRATIATDAQRQHRHHPGVIGAADGLADDHFPDFR